MGNLCPRSNNIEQKASIEQQNRLVAQSQVTDKDKTILRMRNAQDRLLQQKRALQKNSEKCLEEAKALVKQRNREAAKFALRRKKLYDNFLNDAENQYMIMQKAIIEVEAAVQQSEYIKVLDEANDLLKDMDIAGQLEKLQDIGADMREREENTRTFNKMFEEYHSGDVDDLFKQFESEVVDEQIEAANQPLKNVSYPKQEISNEKIEVEENEENDDMSKRLQELA